MSKISRPALRYYGGKWRIAPWIISHFPAHRVYVESFGGGASVLLRKDRAYGEVYNDLDGEVVNVFRVLQRHHRRFKRLMETTPFSRAEFELSCRPHRDPVERARRALIRSFMGFGSDSVTRQVRTGFRANSNRSGSTPAHDWASWPSQIDLFHDRLSGVVIENRDAREVMAAQDGPDTLHYVDPPYIWDTRRAVQAKHGYCFELTDKDHKGLVEFLTSLKGMVILSGYDHEIYSSLGWSREEVETRTFYQNNAMSPRTEVLWFNPMAWDRRGQPTLFSRADP